VPDEPAVGGLDPVALGGAGRLLDRPDVGQLFSDRWIAPRGAHARQRIKKIRDIAQREDARDVTVLAAGFASGRRMRPHSSPAAAASACRDS
jgi:hypothetical protein